MTINNKKEPLTNIERLLYKNERKVIITISCSCQHFNIIHAFVIHRKKLPIQKVKLVLIFRLQLSSAEHLFACISGDCVEQSGAAVMIFAASVQVSL